MYPEADQLTPIPWYLSSPSMIFSGEDEIDMGSKLWVFVIETLAGLGVFLMATGLKMYATCQQLQAQAQAEAAVASGLLRHTERIAQAMRGRLQSLKPQRGYVKMFDFLTGDFLDYDALRALDNDITLDVPAMTEEEIIALPLHRYKSPARHDQGSASSQRGDGIILSMWE